MRILFSLMICSVLLACKSAKKTTEKETENEWVGLIHVNENQCPIYIETSEALNPGKTLPFHTAYPLNLKDNMKKKGLKVKFSYTSSRAMLPEGCGADMVIQLDAITVIP